MWYNKYKIIRKDKTMKKTNLNEIKSITEILCDNVPIKANKEFPIFCSHPFTNNIHTMIMENGKPTFINLTVKEDYQKWRKQLGQLIDKAENPTSIMAYMNKPYYLTWFSLIADYLSEKDYGEILGTAWTCEEFPNVDANVSRKQVINYFKKAKKKYLMNKKELKIFNSFNQGLTVYRGVSADGIPNGLSWTTSLEQAEWFAIRHDTDRKKGYVQKLVIKDKKNILAYFNTREENEVVVDTYNEKSYEIIDKSLYNDDKTIK